MLEIRLARWLSLLPICSSWLAQFVLGKALVTALRRWWRHAARSLRSANTAPSSHARLVQLPVECFLQFGQ